MDQCALKSGHLEAIAPGLSQSPSLTSLSLRYNRFPASATCSLAALISNEQQDQTTGLQQLDLSGNPLQEASLGVMCQALGESRTLKHLIMANCHIYPTGCEALANTLVRQYTYVSLSPHLSFFFFL
jgi:Leucine-rich repeat (LRR) protein